MAQTYHHEQQQTTQPLSAAQVERLAAVGRALADPIRVRMLDLIASGRQCCDLPDMGAPVAEGEPAGICVCEFMAYYGLGQSKVSYHLRKLKEAGLVSEERRGRWSFYSLNQTGTAEVMALLGRSLSAGTNNLVSSIR